MFAVVKTGGKQYRVTPGDVIVVEKIIGETGDKVKLDQILMIDEGEKELKIGSPIVEGVAVNCIVLDQSRTDKILVFKKKRRQGYKRTKGHRQDQTVLRIIDINGGTKNINFNDKIVALGKDGSVGCASIKERKGNNPKLAYWSNDGFKVYKGTYLIEDKSVDYVG